MIPITWRSPQVNCASDKSDRDWSRKMPKPRRQKADLNQRSQQTQRAPAVAQSLRNVIDRSRFDSWGPPGPGLCREHVVIIPVRARKSFVAGPMNRP